MALARPLYGAGGPENIMTAGNHRALENRHRMASKEVVAACS